jgi:hypothetical protein
MAGLEIFAASPSCGVATLEFCLRGGNSSVIGSNSEV